MRRVVKPECYDCHMKGHIVNQQARQFNHGCLLIHEMFMAHLLCNNRLTAVNKPALSFNCYMKILFLTIYLSRAIITL